MQVLIVYDSKTGNTQSMAQEIATGVREIPDIEVIVKNVDEVNNEALLQADGICVGSPTYYGLMSGKIKTIFDTSVKIHGKLEGKVGAAFTSSGGVASGAETTLLAILEAMLIHGMIIQGYPHTNHYGAAAVGALNDSDKSRCRRLGTDLAVLVRKLAR